MKYVLPYFIGSLLLQMSTLFILIGPKNIQFCQNIHFLYGNKNNYTIKDTFSFKDLPIKRWEDKRDTWSCVGEVVVEIFFQAN